MSFRDDMHRRAEQVQSRYRAVFQRAAQMVHQSIVEGSPITGAPGQPVDTGALKSSFILRYTGPLTATITTKIVYAPIIEDNLRGATLRSSVGGFHSVRLTVAGWGRIVDAAARVS